jgi:hypothetical protein
MDTSTHKLVGALAAAVVLGILLLVVLASLMAGASIFLAGTGSRSSCIGSSSRCVPPTGTAAAVVQMALEMATHLYVNSACHGVTSFPTCYDTWYDAGFPQAVIAFGERFWPGSFAWHNGTFQCVSYVLGAYSQVNPLPVSGNAIDFWGLYQHRPGWLEIPSAVAPASQRGLPEPGDIIVWQHAPDGHVAIVTTVVPPTATANGTITFGQADAPSALDAMTIHPDLSVTTWPGYTVLGYIRPLTVMSAVSASNAFVSLASQDAIAAGISPTLFVRQINAESSFNPKALSPAGAEGIAQLLPSTAAALGVDPWDPTASLRAAARLMASYVSHYGGDYAKALAAYNAGPPTVDAALTQCGASWLHCLPAETQHYIQLILSS